MRWWMGAEEPLACVLTGPTSYFVRGLFVSRLPLLFDRKLIGTFPNSQQREIIRELVQNGHDTELAVSMLHARSLRGFERHGALVIERLKDKG